MGEGGGSSDACRLRARGRQKHGVRTLPSRVSSILKGSFSKSVSTRQAGECGGPEGHLQGQVRHPSVACGDTSPCRGGCRGGNAQKGSPARGAGCAGRRRLRGALPVGGGNTPQGPAGPCPMFLRGRCLHRPANLAAARCSRFCRPCALYCRAGVHARRGRGCSDGDRVGLMQRLAPQYTAMLQCPAAGENARPTLRPKTGSDP